MKKLAVIFCLFLLNGCGADEESNEIIPESREVSLNLHSIGIKDEKTISYTHRLENCGYELEIQDKNGIRKKNGICIDQGNVTFSAVGDVNLKLTYPINSNSFYQSSRSSYTVDGKVTILQSESSKTMVLSNEKWSFVTFDYNTVVNKVFVINTYENNLYKFEMLNNNDIYYHAYILAKSTVLVELSNGKTLDMEIDPVPNKHYAMFINSDNLDQENNLGFIFNDAWESATNTEVVNPSQRDVFIKESWIVSTPGLTYDLTDFNFIGISTDSDPYIAIPKNNYVISSLNFERIYQIIGYSDIDFVIDSTQHIRMGVKSNGISYVSVNNVRISLSQFLQDYGNNTITSDISYRLSAINGKFHITKFDVMPDFVNP